MTAEDRAQLRDGAAGDGSSGAVAGDPSGDGHEGEDSARLHRPARSGAAAGEGAARADGGGVPSEPGAGDSFGAWLRRQREMREIDLREIADKTKISLRYLKAMEQDRFEVLPAPVFARGFLREYARYVGLNPDEVVNYYLSAHAEEEDEEDEGAAPSPSSRGTMSRGPLTRGALVTVLVLLAVAVLVYFLVYQDNRSEQEEAAPPPIAPPVDTARPAEPAAEPAVEEEGPEPAPTPSAPLVVTLDFTEQCWVEARVDGGEQVSRLFVAGESLRLEGEERVVLQTLGNAGGVEVQVNGRPLPVTAGPTGTARDVVIDLAEFGGATDADPGEGP